MWGIWNWNWFRGECDFITIIHTNESASPHDQAQQECCCNWNRIHYRAISGDLTLCVPPDSVINYEIALLIMRKWCGRCHFGTISCKFLSWKVNGWREHTYSSWTHILSTDYHLNSTIFNYHKLCLGISNKHTTVCCAASDIPTI